MSGNARESPASLTEKDATLTIGSMLVEWLGAQGGGVATLAGFFLLAAVLLQARRANRLERSRVPRHLRLVPGARNPEPRRIARGPSVARTQRTHR